LRKGDRGTSHGDRRGRGVGFFGGGKKKNRPRSARHNIFFPRFERGDGNQRFFQGFQSWAGGGPPWEGGAGKSTFGVRGTGVNSGPKTSFQPQTPVPKPPFFNGGPRGNSPGGTWSGGYGGAPWETAGPHRQIKLESWGGPPVAGDPTTISSFGGNGRGILLLPQQTQKLRGAEGYCTKPPSSGIPLREGWGGVLKPC